MESGSKVIIIGDGRHDSMGFSAYYCTYVIMVIIVYTLTKTNPFILFVQNTNGKIIGFFIVQKDQVKTKNLVFLLQKAYEYSCLKVRSSIAMEVSGAKTLLEFLISRGIKVDTFATDRSTSVR